MSQDTAGFYGWLSATHSHSSTGMQGRPGHQSRRSSVGMSTLPVVAFSSAAATCCSRFLTALAAGPSPFLSSSDHRPCMHTQLDSQQLPYPPAVLGKALSAMQCLKSDSGRMSPPATLVEGPEKSMSADTEACNACRGCWEPHYSGHLLPGRRPVLNRRLSATRCFDTADLPRRSRCCQCPRRQGRGQPAPLCAPGVWRQPKQAM